MEQLRPSKYSIVKLHIDRAIHLTVRYSECSLDIELHTSIPVVKAHIKNVLFMLKEPHVETKKGLDQCSQYRQLRRYAGPNRNDSYIPILISYQLR